VTTSARTVSYSPAAPASTFVITFPFTAKNQITMVKVLEATGVAVSPFTQGAQYNVFLPVGSTNGYITTTSPVTADYTVTITRATPLTQTTSFRTQGSYSAAAHEDALDKLTFEIQETRAAAGTSGDAAVAVHEAAADPHEQYFLLAGRAGGQLAYGGSGDGMNLQLTANAAGEDGKIIFGFEDGDVFFDEATGYVGIGDDTPDYPLDVVGAIAGSTTLTVPIVYGSGTTGGDLTLKGNSAAANGNIYFGTASTYDQANDRFGIGTLSPATPLEVAGQVRIGTATPRLRLGSDGVTAYVAVMSDDVASSVSLLANAAADLGIASTGLTAYGPSHASLAGHARLYGSQIDLAVDPNTAPHSYFTNTMVYLDGAVLSQSFIANTASTPTSPTLDECGTVYEADFASEVIQLPDLGNNYDSRGCVFTLINSFADGTQSVAFSPHASDAIVGSCVGITGAGAATVVQASGVVDQDWRNTAATSNKGDYTTLVSNFAKGAAGLWYIIGCVGEWGSVAP
jgi:hypothetical protein